MRSGGWFESSCLCERSNAEIVFSSPPFVAQLRGVSPSLVGTSVCGRKKVKNASVSG